MQVERYNNLKLSNAELSIFGKAMYDFLENGNMPEDDVSIARHMLDSLEQRFLDPVNGDVRLRSGNNSKRNNRHGGGNSGGSWRRDGVKAQTEAVADAFEG